MSDGQTSTTDIVSQLTPEQQAEVVQHAQANGLSGEALREYIETNFNQQSTNNEAHLAQGGYDAGVAMAVAGSTGVGGSEEATQQAAADFARMAAQAIANGQPLDQVRFNDPALTDAAKEAIYEQVAQQQGTSADEIARKAEEARQADMQAIQGGMGMLIGGALFGAAGATAAATSRTDNEYGVTAERMAVAPASLSLLGSLTPANVPDVRDREIGRGQGGWSMA